MTTERTAIRLTRPVSALAGVSYPLHGAAARTIHTGPRANVIGWPDMVVNVVPPSGPGRDHRVS